MARIKRWKTEKYKIRTIVREKKKECCQTFCKENGEKDPWEIVKWAKDPWPLKAIMHYQRTFGALTPCYGAQAPGLCTIASSGSGASWASKWAAIWSGIGAIFRRIITPVAP